ncbi:TPA: hypothetical protein ACOQ31_004547 [Bacillus cereus]|uniref:hypothetical protein n=1 Tax=Bacillus cereus TaxID=1396 RepID=UPI00019FFC6B|nr:hypothetical protein [Bacillus cereus]EEK57830.1 hypothetical protein bcere0004_6780 [Bacillus cereus BGSC 6E1]MBL3764074.1 hypothetical protein [Bacillus cereus]MBL3772635.1 hypothetical protein [Bacillus cereus]MBL3775759.1 hypothetical protein [Bacillus cereus]MBL3786868.1 hypothetical protein [Bacillus cereus]
MQTLKEFLGKIPKWLYVQFDGGSDAVEYISWLTAAIFSVLAVFTIFLAHQYQSNTSESFKIIWKIKEAARKKRKNDFAQLLEDFTYLSSIPNIVVKSIQTCQIVIYSLVSIWILSGISILVNKSFNKQGEFQYILFLLILSITFIFIFFSIRLLHIIKQITNEGNNELSIKNTNQLKNINKLYKLKYPIINIIEFDEITWNLNLINDEPYLDSYIKRDFGFNSCHVLLSISCNKSTIFLGINLIDDNLEQDLNLKQSTKRKINRFFSENSMPTYKSYICYILNEKVISYTTEINLSGEGDYSFKIKDKTSWEPPKQIETQLLKDNFIEIINIVH